MATLEDYYKNFTQLPKKQTRVRRQAPNIPHTDYKVFPNAGEYIPYSTDYINLQIAHNIYNNTQDINDKLSVLIFPDLTVEMAMALAYQLNEKTIVNPNNNFIVTFNKNNCVVRISEYDLSLTFTYPNLRNFYQFPYGYTKGNWHGGPDSAELPATNIVNRIVYPLSAYARANNDIPQRFKDAYPNKTSQELQAEWENYLDSRLNEATKVFKFNTTRLFTMRPGIYRLEKFWNHDVRLPERELFHFIQGRFNLLFSSLNLSGGPSEFLEDTSVKFNYDGPFVVAAFDSKRITENIAKTDRYSNIWQYRPNDQEYFWSNFIPLIKRLIGVSGEDSNDGYKNYDTESQFLYIHMNPVEFISTVGIQLAKGETNCLIDLVRPKLTTSKSSQIKVRHLDEYQKTLKGPATEKDIDNIAKIMYSNIIVYSPENIELYQSKTNYKQSIKVFDYNGHAVKSVAQPKSYTIKIVNDFPTSPHDVVKFLRTIDAKMFFVNVSNIIAVNEDNTCYVSKNYSNVHDTIIRYNNKDQPEKFSTVFSYEASQWRKRFNKVPELYQYEWMETVIMPCEYKSSDNDGITIDLSDAYPAAHLNQKEYDLFGFPGEIQYMMKTDNPPEFFTGIVYFTLPTKPNDIIMTFLRQDYDKDKKYAVPSHVYYTMKKFKDFNPKPYQILVANKRYHSFDDDKTSCQDSNGKILPKNKIIRQYIGTLQPNETRRTGKIYTNDDYMKQYYTELLTKNNTLANQRDDEDYKVIEYYQQSRNHSHIYNFILGYTVVRMLNEISRYNLSDIICFKVDSLTVSNFKIPEDGVEDLNNMIRIYQDKTVEIKEKTPGIWKYSKKPVVSRYNNRDRCYMETDNEYNQDIVNLLNSQITLLHGPSGAGKTYYAKNIIKHFTHIILTPTIVLRDNIGNAHTWQSMLWQKQDKPFESNKQLIVAPKVVFITEIGKIPKYNAEIILEYLKQIGCVIIVDGDKYQMGAFKSEAAWSYLEKYTTIELRGDKRALDNLSQIKQQLWQKSNNDCRKILSNYNRTNKYFEENWHPLDYVYVITNKMKYELTIKLNDIKQKKYKDLKIRYKSTSRKDNGTVMYAEVNCFAEMLAELDKEIEPDFVQTYASCQGLTADDIVTGNTTYRPKLWLIWEDDKIMNSWDGANYAIYTASTRARYLDQINIVYEEKKIYRSIANDY